MTDKSADRERKVKVLWLNEWNIEEQEAWFMDMARQGWQLEHLGLWLVTFVEAPPQEISYRIEIAKKNYGIEEERIQLYDDAGWDYVTSRRFVHVFREKEANEAAEIHTDPALQAESIEILKKSIWKNGIAVILFTVSIIILRLYTFSHLTSTYLLNNQVIGDIFITIVYLSLVFECISGIIHITSLIRKLRKGIGFQHNLNYKRKLNRKRFVGLSILFLWALLFIVLIITMPTQNTDKMYPEIPAGELPVISLTDIEGVDLSQVTFNTNGIARKRDNHFAEESSILVPKQSILHQRFIIPEETWNNSREKYQPGIDSKKYEALTAGIAEKLIDILLEEDYKQEQFIENEMTGFDEYWTMVDHSMVTIFARAGKRVYDINYYGNESLEEINKHLINLENAN